MFSASSSIYMKGELKASDCRYSVGHPSYFSSREMANYPRGKRRGSRTMADLYSSMRPFSRLASDNVTGATFGLDFTPDGRILGAAYERRMLQFFDPLTRKLISSVSEAHSDCVNTIKFLDDRIFASCSDDKLVKLWDLRSTKSAVRSMSGHTNWVKSIDYDPTNGILLSSSFDGYIYAWNVNNYNEFDSADFTPVFYTPGLIRSRLCPDGSKLLLSTLWGYIMVIHDLDIKKCYSDLSGFKPNICWLTLKTGATVITSENHLKYFETSRNRTELILDFPPGNEPDNVTSLTMHPHNWCVLSRNTSHGESSEWTCVHDIQWPPAGDPFVDFDDNETIGGGAGITENTEVTTMATVRLTTGQSAAQGSSEPRILSARSHSGRTIIAIEMATGDQTAEAARRNADVVSFTTTIRYNANTPSHHGNSWSNSAVTESPSSSSSSDDDNVSPPRRPLRPALNVDVDSVPPSTSTPSNPRARAIFLPQDPQNPQQRLLLILSNTASVSPDANSDHRAAIKNVDAAIDEEGGEALPRVYRRLLRHAQEPNVGRGYIKEQSFSADGRLIASPYGFGVRLLGFSADCRELCDCSDAVCYSDRNETTLRSPIGHSPARKNQRLYETGVSINHNNVVLCTKFSPTHVLLASGCLSGEISFYQPVL